MKKSIAISIISYIAIMVITCIIPLNFTLQNAKYESKNAVVNFEAESDLEKAYYQLTDTDEITRNNFTMILEHYNDIIKFEKDNFIKLSIYFSVIVNVLVALIGLLVKKKNKIVGITIILAALISLILFIACTLYFTNHIMVI